MLSSLTCIAKCLFIISLANGISVCFTGAHGGAGLIIRSFLGVADSAGGCFSGSGIFLLTSPTVYFPPQGTPQLI